MEYYELGYFDSHRESLTLLGDQSMCEKLTDNLYPIPKDSLDDVLRDCVFSCSMNQKSVAVLSIRS